MDSMSTARNDDETGIGLRKQVGVDARARRKPQHILYLATYLGMLVLLIAVTAVVVARAPDFPSDPAFIITWNKRHESSANFSAAKSLIRPLVITCLEKRSRSLSDFNPGRIGVVNGVGYALPAVDTKSNDGATAHPSSWAIEKWSRAFFDADTDCIEAGNGVWRATGTVDARSGEGVAVRLPWTIYFVAETATPLFSKVGDVESGDIIQAQKVARSKPPISAISR